MCGICNVWLCVRVGFVMCVFVLCAFCNVCVLQSVCACVCLCMWVL